MADKKLQAGDLDRKIKLFHRNDVRDNHGVKTSIDNEPYAEVWAKKADKSGSEKEEAGVKTQAVATTEFTIRYRDDVKKTDVIECKGIRYDVQSVGEGEGRLQWTVITTKTRD
ncbi:phage head closure protein [Spirosoma sp. BT702]|uniref:Phage head closure protein n=1 Tax=Spirosoma profusum TaxID=2771354 RepID=A0A927AWE9_9BACT|nr:phage head closure protein [Spirosoma profusum]MBD2705611.1 phage head closure protein [Spirosoma profusum]